MRALGAAIVPVTYEQAWKPAEAKKLIAVGESMGGLAGAQLVTGRRIPGLRAYAGISPLCDLGSVHEEYEESIEAAYGQAVDEAVWRFA